MARLLSPVSALSLSLALGLGLGACAGSPPAPGRLSEEALGFNQRGARAYERGDLAQARSLYERALEIDAGIDNTEGVALNSLSLARVSQALGDAEAAHRHLDRALETAAAPWRAEAAARKAQLHLATGELALADEWLGRAQNLCGQCRAQAAILNLGARIALAGSQPALAAQRAGRALQLPVDDAARPERANAQRILGEAKMAQGDTEGAAQAFSQALKIDHALGLAGRIELDQKLMEAAQLKLRQQRLASPTIGSPSGEMRGETR
jgi:Tfp pilus assembly protein PilF